MRGGQGELKWNQLGREEMETRIDDSETLRRNQELTYDRARIAYEQQDYELAAIVINQFMENSSDDPNAHLLKGHIYYMLQQYDVAQDEYQNVLHLTDDQEIISLVNNCLATINQFIQPFGDDQSAPYDLLTTKESLDLGVMGNLNGSMNSFEEYEPPLDSLEHNPFASHLDSMEFDSNSSDRTITEDADTSFEVYRQGWKISQEPEAISYTDAPEKISVFIDQRKRWLYGVLQTIVIHKWSLKTLNPWVLWAWIGYLLCPLTIISLIFPIYFLF